MRIEILSGLSCLAVSVAGSARSQEEVRVTFDETEAGLRVSYEASVDLSGLTRGGLGEPFTSRFFGINGFGMQLNLAASDAGVEEHFARGSFVFAFDVFPMEFFDTENAINDTGDNFGLAVRGSDIPFLLYILPEDYVSGTPLSGSVTYPELSFTEVAPLMGAFPLDFDETRFITFRTIPEPASIVIVGVACAAALTRGRGSGLVFACGRGRLRPAT